MITTDSRTPDDKIGNGIILTREPVAKQTNKNYDNKLANIGITEPRERYGNECI